VTYYIINNDGGVVSEGDGSLIEMNNCTVRHMRQMGIEARNDGAIKAMNGLIVENQFHGVAIGPRFSKISLFNK
jgi:hypothetical protein